MAVIPGVLNELPLPKLLPPDGLLNQLMVPAVAEAESVTLPESHMLPEMPEVMEGVLFTMAIAGVLVEVHPL